MNTVKAAGMAREAGIDPKTYRAALRREGFRWHAHNHPWTVVKGSSEHRDMLRVLNALLARL